MTDYKSSHVGVERGRTYDQRYASGAEHYYWMTFEKPYVETLFNRLSAACGTRYLDFATGTGRILQIAAPHFSEAVGVDVSADMLKEAGRKAPGARLIHADVTADVLDIGKFNVISCFRFILNAQPDLRMTVLKWLRQVIDEDGVLVINNHLNRWSLTGVACQLSNALRGETRHNLLSDREVAELMAQCGFSIDEQHDFCLLPAWRNNLMLPAGWVTTLERIAGKLPLLGKLSKDRIYLCRPV